MQGSGERLGSWDYGDTPPAPAFRMRSGTESGIGRLAANDAWHPTGQERIRRAQESRGRQIVQALRRFGATFDEHAAIYGALGFVLGILAWHMIGFWGFVSDVVLHDPATAAAHAPLPAKAIAMMGEAPQQATATAGLTTGSISPTERHMTAHPAATPPLACAALELDRGSGATRQVACTGDAMALKDAGYQRRSTLAAITPQLQNPNVWAAGTELRPDAVADAAAGNAVSEQDVELSLSPGR